MNKNIKKILFWFRDKNQSSNFIQGQDNLDTIIQKIEQMFPQVTGQIYSTYLMINNRLIILNSSDNFENERKQLKQNEIIIKIQLNADQLAQAQKRSLHYLNIQSSSSQGIINDNHQMKTENDESYSQQELHSEGNIEYQQNIKQSNQKGKEDEVNDDENNSQPQEQDHKQQQQSSISSQDHSEYEFQFEGKKEISDEEHPCEKQSKLRSSSQKLHSNNCSKQNQQQIDQQNNDKSTTKQQQSKDIKNQKLKQQNQSQNQELDKCQVVVIPTQNPFNAHNQQKLNEPQQNNKNTDERQQPKNRLDLLPSSMKPSQQPRSIQPITNQQHYQQNKQYTQDIQQSIHQNQINNRQNWQQLYLKLQEQKKAKENQYKKRISILQKQNKNISKQLLTVQHQNQQLKSTILISRNQINALINIPIREQLLYDSSEIIQPRTLAQSNNSYSRQSVIQLGLPFNSNQSDPVSIQAKFYNIQQSFQSMIHLNENSFNQSHQFNIWQYNRRL